MDVVSPLFTYEVVWRDIFATFSRHRMDEPVEAYRERLQSIDRQRKAAEDVGHVLQRLEHTRLIQCRDY